MMILAGPGMSASAASMWVSMRMPTYISPLLRQYQSMVDSSPRSSSMEGRRLAEMRRTSLMVSLRWATTFSRGEDIFGGGRAPCARAGPSMAYLMAARLAPMLSWSSLEICRRSFSWVSTIFRVRARKGLLGFAQGVFDVLAFIDLPPARLPPSGPALWYALATMSSKASWACFNWIWAWWWAPADVVPPFDVQQLDGQEFQVTLVGIFDDVVVHAGLEGLNGQELRTGAGEHDRRRAERY